MRGIIKFYDEEKGFGFIVSDESNEDLYFNEKNVSSECRPYRKQKVEFRPIKTDRGSRRYLYFKI
jgi:cold shock CspA family protein